MDHSSPPPASTTGLVPAATPGVGPPAGEVSVGIWATHQLRRVHDDSVISTHCGLAADSRPSKS